MVGGGRRFLGKRAGQVESVVRRQKRKASLFRSSKQTTEGL
jgi:hypothetical protein